MYNIYLKNHKLIASFLYKKDAQEYFKEKKEEMRWKLIDAYIKESNIIIPDNWNIYFKIIDHAKRVVAPKVKSSVYMVYEPTE